MDEITLRWILLGLFALVMVGFWLFQRRAEKHRLPAECGRCHSPLPKGAARCPKCGSDQVISQGPAGPAW
jgi:ribosomal protein L40E